MVYNNLSHDNYWGLRSYRDTAPFKRKYGMHRHCYGTGEDPFGKILMQVRQELLEAAQPIASKRQCNFEVKEYV